MLCGVVFIVSFVKCHQFVSSRLKEEDAGNAAAAASGKNGMTPLQAAALQQLPKLMRLRTLVLKDFGGAKVTDD